MAALGAKATLLTAYIFGADGVQFALPGPSSCEANAIIVTIADARRNFLAAKG